MSENMNALKGIPFEEALERLEEVVKVLEKGEAPLEEAIQLFDEGMKLAHVCNEKLESAEQQVEALIQTRGSWVKKPLAREDEQD